MNNENNEFDTSMGDAFRQRRSAKQKGTIDNAQQQQLQRDTFPVAVTTRPPSMLEIQAEEERLSRQARATTSNTSNSGLYDMSRRMSDRRNGGENNNGGAAFSRGRRGGGDASDRVLQHLPLEHGCVCSLKDGFGFIYCADRPEELFFHFSEVQNCHPADLIMDDELEFRVGNDRNSDKLRAFQVLRLERGSVVWEVEDKPGVRFQGVVEKPVRAERSGNLNQDGVIRILEKPPQETTGGEEQVTATAGAMILFSQNDLQPNEENLQVHSPSVSGGIRTDYRRGYSSPSNNMPRVGGGSGGDIVGRLGIHDLVEFAVVTSRRTKSKHARSIRLLQSDRERQIALKEAALLANAKDEQGIVTSLKTDYGFLRSNKRREEIYFHYSHVLLDDDNEEEQSLKVGNEMTFLVITEDSSGNGRKPRICARQVRFLPAGTVKFETMLAHGVTGIVTRCPQPVDSSHSSEVPGVVRLTECITDLDDDGNELTVTDVGFYVKDSPGGTYHLREGILGLWIREGDTILFDVVKDIVDGFVRVFPTTKQCGDGVTDENETPSVKLVCCALALRQEGTVHVIKEEFGFINLAERTTETYFRLYEQFPKEIQRDLLRGMAINDQPCLEMAVDSEVHFDMSIQREMRPKSRNQRGGGQQESLKARRILILPPGTILQTKVLALGVDGIVEKEDPSQAYAGTIELTTEVSGMTIEERHPLVAMLVRSVLEQKDGAPKAFIFPDVQSVKEDDVVRKVVENVSDGLLRCSNLPTAGQGKNGGRLCIACVENDDEKYQKSDSGEPIVELDSSLTIAADTSDAVDSSGSPSKRKKSNLKVQKQKMVKLVRYGKQYLANEFQAKPPPRAGDRVTCDVIQSRRSGAILLRDIRIQERKIVDPADTSQMESSEAGVGIVSDVVVARNFGFISVLDEGSSKREILFFHLDGICGESGRRAVRKGDEVKFKIITQKGGKRAAVDVEILARGTLNIASKAAKNSCEGFVLMEPYHTSLKNNPRSSASPAPRATSPKQAGEGAGRWSNVDLGSDRGPKATAKEEGSILLIKDPSNMFGKSLQPEQPVLSTESADFDATDDKISNAEDTEGPFNPALCTHVSYKLGTIAIHGVGATNGADSSVQGPRRGDLVSFVKSKDGKGVRDVRVVTKGAATLIRGHLEQIIVDLNSADLGSALFVATTDMKEVYQIKLEEIISCDVAVLQDKEPVEGLLHDGMIFGICRNKDVVLESKLGSSSKMRTKLNLTVKQGLGGKIMAQSMMGKGPDDSIGFAKGWTTRVSKYAASDGEG